MNIIPCSVKTLSGMNHGDGDDLISRAGDVISKERRKPVMVVRGTLLIDTRLKSMLSVTQSGAIVFPPMAFYSSGLE